MRDNAGCQDEYSQRSMGQSKRRSTRQENTIDRKAENIGQTSVLLDYLR